MQSCSFVVYLSLLSGVAAVGVAASPRSRLLQLIAPLDRGFKASSKERNEVATAIQSLAESTSQQFVPDLTGDWELIYTDAPDILGLDVQVLAMVSFPAISFAVKATHFRMVIVAVSALGACAS